MIPINDAITREWLSEKRVLRYTIKRMSITDMFDWSHDIDHVLQRWQADQPYLAIYDLLHPGVSVPFLVLADRNIFNLDPSPLGRYRVAKWLDRHPLIDIRIALLLSPNASGELTRRYARYVNTSRSQYHVFSSQTPAMEWLLSENASSEEAGS